MRAYDQLPDVEAVQKATEATQKLSRYRDQLVKEPLVLGPKDRGQTANLNRLHGERLVLWAALSPVRPKHRVTTGLANQYPGYKDFFGEINGVTALHFWAEYPTPSHLKGTTEDELVDFFYEKSNHRLGEASSREKARSILSHLDERSVPDLDLLTEAQGQVISDLAQRLLQLKRSIEALYCATL